MAPRPGYPVTAGHRQWSQIGTFDGVTPGPCRGKRQSAAPASGTGSNAVEGPLRPQNEMRDSQLTAALKDAAKLLRPDSADATRNPTLARDDRLAKIDGRRDSWSRT